MQMQKSNQKKQRHEYVIPTTFKLHELVTIKLTEDSDPRNLEMTTESGKPAWNYYGH